MRGYLTFVIVFAACLLILSLAQFNVTSKYSNMGRSIWVESYYQHEMNVKEAIFEAAREGAVEGIINYAREYVTTCVASRPEAPSPPNIDCLKIRINEKAVDKIKALDNQRLDGALIKVLIRSDYEPLIQQKCMTPCPQSQTLINYNYVVLADGIDLNEFDDFINSYKTSSSSLNQFEKIAGIVPRFYLTDGVIIVTISRQGFEDLVFQIPQKVVEMT
ncbi:MAG: hypothetical protein QW153_02565 [Candidatus Bilamarchaeaceae archaeon]